MTDFRMPEVREMGVAEVKVIGVGGAGGNAINTMMQSKISGVSFIAANTDKQDLERSQAESLIVLGQECTNGLGAGANPEVGRAAALESEKEIRAMLEGADMVFITAGLGGGTGTGGAPVVAKISKELGALTVAVVTKPFKFEGKLKIKRAEEGWKELREAVDTIVTIPNERLLSMMESGSKLDEMFALSDTVLVQAVQGINDLINAKGYMNVDFADLRTVMKEVGPAVMGCGEASGEGRASKAATKAIDNQLLENVGIEGARGVLVNISASKESFNMSEMLEVGSLIEEKAESEAQIMFGVLYDDSLGDLMRVTVVATGIGEVHEAAPVNPMQQFVDYGKKSVDGEGLKGVMATPNQNPSNITPIPRSSFDMMGGRSNVGNSTGKDTSWDDLDLDTPAYLRRKAN